MSNGDVSPKYGDKAFTHGCNFESRITKVRISTKENRLIGLIFYTDHDGEFLRIEGSVKTNNTVTLDMESTESLIGFQMRIASGALQGMAFVILSSETTIETKKEIEQMRRR